METKTKNSSEKGRKSRNNSPSLTQFKWLESTPAPFIILPLIDWRNKRNRLQHKQKYDPWKNGLKAVCSYSANTEKYCF